MKHKIKHLEGKYKAVTWGLVQCCTDSELRLYLFLKFHAIEKNLAWPTTRTIQKSLGWGSEKVIRAIKSMEQNGRLTIERDHRKASIYDITWYDRQNEKGFLSEPEEVTLRKPKHTASETETPTVSETETQQQGIKQQGKNNIVSTSSNTKKKWKNEDLMTIELFTAYCEKSPQRHIQIIGGWADAIRPDCQTYEQWMVFFDRNLKAARKLKPFTDEQIQNAYRRIQEDISKKDGMDFKPALETLVKYIIK